MFCTQCGKKFEAENKYCSNCGHKIEVTSVEPATLETFTPPPEPAPETEPQIPGPPAHWFESQLSTPMPEPEPKPEPEPVTPKPVVSPPAPPTPRRSLMSALSFLWSANCPTLLYGIKCGIMTLVAEQLLIAMMNGLASSLLYSASNATFAVAWGLGSSIVAGILRWFAKHFWPTLLRNIFVDLEGALFWIDLVRIVVIVTAGGIFTALLDIRPFESNAPFWLIATVIAFIVARRLRRATELE